MRCCMRKSDKTQESKFPDLKKILETIRALHTRNVQITDRVLGMVDKSLESLNRKNFDEVGVPIVIYAKILAMNPRKHRRKLNHLNAKLRKLRILPDDQDVIVYNDLWKDTIIPILSIGAVFSHNSKKGMFFYYYYVYQLNQLIVGGHIPDEVLISTLDVSHLVCIEEQNLSRMLSAALTLEDQSVLNGILGYYQGLGDQGRKELQIIMQHALKMGCCEVVEYLLAKGLKLPKSIDEVILVLMTAITSNCKYLILNVFSCFSVEQILEAAERHHGPR